MMNLKGTHGTSVSRAESIRQNGFIITSGRGGKGAYLWRNSAYSDFLARAWHSQKYYDGDFNRDIDQECAIIHAVINVSENQFLDLEDPDIKDGLTHLAISKKIDLRNKKELSALYDSFVAEVEKQIMTKILTVQLRVATPKSEYVKNYPMAIAGLPLSYIVREPKIIEITEII